METIAKPVRISKGRPTDCPLISILSEYKFAGIKVVICGKYKNLNKITKN